MESDTLLLMRLYWRLDWRQTSERSGMRLFRIGLLALVGIFLAVMSGLGGYGLGQVMQMPDIPLDINPGFIPGAILTVVLLAALLTSPNQAVRALYLSDDLDQLVAAPIKTRSITVSKLLTRLSWTILFVLILAGPALITYGIGIGAGIGYYIAAFILLFLAPLFGLSIGALLAMILVRWLPAKRLGEMLAAAYALIGILIALLFQLPRFIDFSGAADPQTVETLGKISDTVTNAPIPTLLAGQGLIDVGQGQLSLGLSRMVAYILITLGLFIVTILLSDRLYISGWLRMQGNSAKRRGITEDSGRLQGGSLLSTIAVKDWLLRLRDPRQLVSLVGGSLIAIVVGGLAIFRGTGGEAGLLEASQSGALDLPRQFAFFAAAFSPGVILSSAVLFVGYTVFNQLSTTSLALEGHSFPILKSAPITPRQVWQGKAISAWVPYAVVVTVLIIIAWVVVRFSLPWAFYAWACLLLMGTGMIAMNTSLGFRFANLEWTDTRRMITGAGGFYIFLISAVYLLATGLIALLFFALAAVFPVASIPLAIVGLIVIAAGTAFWIWLAGKWAESAWNRLGEE
ncbi:MAG: ABC transporter permease [Chloroflexota bacterium]